MSTPLFICLFIFLTNFSKNPTGSVCIYVTRQVWIWKFLNFVLLFFHITFGVTDLLYRILQMYVAMKAVRLIIKREFVLKTFIGNYWQLFRCRFYFLLF